MHELGSLQLEMINKTSGVYRQCIYSCTILHFKKIKSFFNKAFIITKKPGDRGDTGEARGDVSPPIPALRFLPEGITLGSKLPNRQKICSKVDI